MLHVEKKTRPSVLMPLALCSPFYVVDSFLGFPSGKKELESTDLTLLKKSVKHWASPSRKKEENRDHLFIYSSTDRLLVRQVSTTQVFRKTRCKMFFWKLEELFNGTVQDIQIQLVVSKSWSSLIQHRRSSIRRAWRSNRRPVTHSDPKAALIKKPLIFLSSSVSIQLGQETRPEWWRLDHLW